MDYKSMGKKASLERIKLTIPFMQCSKSVLQTKFIIFFSDYYFSLCSQSSGKIIITCDDCCYAFIPSKTKNKTINAAFFDALHS